MELAQVLFNSEFMTKQLSDPNEEYSFIPMSLEAHLISCPVCLLGDTFPRNVLIELESSLRGPYDISIL